MRFLYTLLIIICLPVANFSQVPNYPAVVGLTFENSSLTPSNVVPASGQLQPLSQQPTSNDHFISGNSTLDVARQIYYYVSSNPARLYGVDLTSGQLMYNYVIPRDNMTTYPLSGIQFNPKDSLIYGIRQQSNGLFLVSFDPQLGQLNQLSTQPIAQAIHHAGDATLDTASGTYYLPWGNRNSMLAAVDISTGQTQTIMVADPLTNVHTIARMLNVQFNHADGFIYGLHFSTGALRFGRLDPTSGQITLLSNGPISGDMFQIGNCTIDEQNGVYYYTRMPYGNGEIVAVDIASAQVLAAPMINPLNAHASFTNPEFNSLAQPAARFQTVVNCDNSSVSFGNQSLGSQFEWDFGDGTTSTSIHPKHQYGQPGTYQVTLRSHAHQQTHALTQQVEVKPPLQVAIDGPDRFIAGEKVTLVVNDDMDSYQWDNGSTKKSILITHGGTYTVDVVKEGCQAQTSFSVVNETPFTMDKSEVITTSYDQAFSSSMQVENTTGKTLTYAVTAGNQLPFNWSSQISATGDVALQTTNAYSYEMTIPPYGKGEVMINWNAPNSGTGEVNVKIMHPFGGTMESIKFLGIAKVITSVEPPVETSPVTLFPNPVGAGQYVNWSQPITEPGLVFDAMGRKVGEVPSGVSTFKLPNTAGIYFVRLADGQQFSVTVVR